MNKLYTVFGSPVLHSKSPQLFHHLLEAGDFYTRIRPGSAPDLIRMFRLWNIRGASVTSPFKESIFPLIDEASDTARHIGAVNCIRYEGGSIAGHNTDHHGVNAALEEAGVDLNGARILVLGAGGAARAAVYGLVRAGAGVSVCNRTRAKAERIGLQYGADVIGWDDPAPRAAFDVVVSALLPEAKPPFADRWEYGLLLDAIYKPSAMKAHALTRGIPAISGERWLIHQGIEAARFYMDKNPQPRTMALELDKIPNRENLRILVADREKPADVHRLRPDLVISAPGMNKARIKRIIHEEKVLAFGG